MKYKDSQATPEERSDELDKRMVLVTSKELAGLRRLNIILWALIVFASLSFTAQFAILARLSTDTKRLGESNNKILSSQIAGLEKGIQGRDKTIEDQAFVINQAVEAIKKLAGQVQELGGDPGTVTLQPPKDN